MSVYKVTAERQGQLVEPTRLARAVQDANRSCSRGLGGPSKVEGAEGLPLERLCELPGTREPWVTGGPMWPKRALIFGFLVFV